MPNENKNAITPYEGSEVLNGVDIPDSQKAIVKNAIMRIVNTSSAINLLENEIKIVKNDIAESVEFQKLKEFKRQLRELKHVNAEAVSHYNGAFEMALADTPGENLAEKIKQLTSGR